MYARTLRRHHQTHRFVISDPTRAGWEVREEEDDRLLTRAVYTDWHRVERARIVFASRASDLKNAGWTE